jgi:hypothetical protein
MTRYWIGVASKDHVDAGVAGGFCQTDHGKSVGLEKLRPGDWIVYYAPKMEMGAGETVRAFVAIGEIQPGEPYQVEMTPEFHPWRRDVNFRADAQQADIYPLLDDLSFITDRSHWGIKFRRSLFEVSEADFRRIAVAMGVAI